MAFLIEGKNIPYFCTFVFPHNFLWKCSHSESEVIEIFIVTKKMLLVDFKQIRHGKSLICIKSYNDHNFVKIYEKLPKSCQPRKNR